MHLSRQDRWLAGVLLAQAAWGAAMIAQTSFELEGERVFCLFDDAMISMTYARNLWEGHGLNWARWGAPVEGYTSPLWLGVMIAFHAAPLAANHASLPIQICSLGLLIATAWSVARLTTDLLGPPGRLYGVAAAALCGFYYPLAHWSILGMETAGLALLMVISVRAALSAVDQSRPGYLRLFAPLGAALLLRMDAAVFVAIIGAFIWRGRLLSWRDRRRWLPAMSAALAPFVAYVLFRLLYFDELLPSAYDLKLTGVPLGPRILRGALVMADTLWPQGLVLALVLVAVLSTWRRLPTLTLLVALLAGQLGYSVFVGGDAWEWAGIGANRFVSPAMPLAFALIAIAVGFHSGRLRRAGVLALFALCGLSANGLLPSATTALSARRWLLIEPPLHVPDHVAKIRALRLVQRAARDEPTEKLAVVAAGIPAYFSGFQMVDIMGRNDARIAKMRSPVRLEWSAPRRYYPGHMKWDHAYSIGELRPTHVLLTWVSWDPRRDPRGLESDEVAAQLRAWGYVRRAGFWSRGTARR